MMVESYNMVSPSRNTGTVPFGFMARNSRSFCSFFLRLTKIGSQASCFSASTIRTFWHHGQVGQ